MDVLMGLLLAPCPVAPGAVADVPTLYITLMDTVSCRVLHRTTHFHAMAPVSLLLVENWVLYSYWNTRAQRTEVRRHTVSVEGLSRHHLKFRNCAYA